MCLNIQAAFLTTVHVRRYCFLTKVLGLLYYPTRDEAAGFTSMIEPSKLSEEAIGRLSLGIPLKSILYWKNKYPTVNFKLSANIHVV